jgi:hypothetical protein
MVEDQMGRDVSFRSIQYTMTKERKKEKDVQPVKEKDFGWISKVSSVLPILEGGMQNVWQKMGAEKSERHSQTGRAADEAGQVTD